MSKSDSGKDSLPSRLKEYEQSIPVYKRNGELKQRVVYDSNKSRYENAAYMLTSYLDEIQHRPDNIELGDNFGEFITNLSQESKPLLTTHHADLKRKNLVSDIVELIRTCENSSVAQDVTEQVIDTFIDKHLGQLEARGGLFGMGDESTLYVILSKLNREGLQEKIRKLEQEKADLKKGLEEKLEIETEKVTLLTKELKETNNKLLAAEKENSELEEEKEGMRENLTSQGSQISNLNRRIKLLEAEEVKLKNEIQTLGNQKQHQKETNTTLHKELLESNQQKQKIEEKNEYQQKQIEEKDLISRVSQDFLPKELAQANRALEKVQKRKEQLEEEKNGLSEINEKAHITISNLEEQITEHKEHISAYKKQVSVIIERMALNYTADEHKTIQETIDESITLRKDYKDLEKILGESLNIAKKSHENELYQKDQIILELLMKNEQLNERNSRLYNLLATIGFEKIKHICQELVEGIKKSLLGKKEHGYLAKELTEDTVFQKVMQEVDSSAKTIFPNVGSIYLAHLQEAEQLMRDPKAHIPAVKIASVKSLLGDEDEQITAPENEKKSKSPSPARSKRKHKKEKRSRVVEFSSTSSTHDTNLEEENLQIESEKQSHETKLLLQVQQQTSQIDVQLNEIEELKQLNTLLESKLETESVNKDTLEQNQATTERMSNVSRESRKETETLKETVVKLSQNARANMDKVLKTAQLDKNKIGEDLLKGMTACLELGEKELKEKHAVELKEKDKKYEELDKNYQLLLKEHQNAMQLLGTKTQLFVGVILQEIRDRFFVSNLTGENDVIYSEQTLKLMKKQFSTVCTHSLHQLDSKMDIGGFSKFLQEENGGFKNLMETFEQWRDTHTEYSRQTPVIREVSLRERREQLKEQKKNKKESTSKTSASSSTTKPSMNGNSRLTYEELEQRYQELLDKLGERRANFNGFLEKAKKYKAAYIKTKKELESIKKSKSIDTAPIASQEIDSEGLDWNERWDAWGEEDTHQSSSKEDLEERERRMEDFTQENHREQLKTTRNRKTGKSALTQSETSSVVEAYETPSFIELSTTGLDDIDLSPQSPQQTPTNVYALMNQAVAADNDQKETPASNQEELPYSEVPMIISYQSLNEEMKQKISTGHDPSAEYDEAELRIQYTALLTRQLQTLELNEKQSHHIHEMVKEYEVLKNEYKELKQQLDEKTTSNPEYKRLQSELNELQFAHKQLIKEHQQTQRVLQLGLFHVIGILIKNITQQFFNSAELNPGQTLTVEQQEQLGNARKKFVAITENVISSVVKPSLIQFVCSESGDLSGKYQTWLAVNAEARRKDEEKESHAKSKEDSEQPKQNKKHSLPHLFGRSRTVKEISATDSSEQPTSIEGIVDEAHQQLIEASSTQPEKPSVLDSVANKLFPNSLWAPRTTKYSPLESTKPALEDTRVVIKVPAEILLKLEGNNPEPKKKQSAILTHASFSLSALSSKPKKGYSRKISVSDEVAKKLKCNGLNPAERTKIYDAIEQTLIQTRRSNEQKISQSKTVASTSSTPEYETSPLLGQTSYPENLLFSPKSSTSYQPVSDELATATTKLLFKSRGSNTIT